MKTLNPRGENLPHTIQHVILTNEFRVTHSMATLDPDNLEACCGLLPDGGLVPFVDESFHVQVEGPTFTIFRCDCPILAGGIGRGKDRTWYELISLLDDLNLAYDRKPHPKLWLAIVHLPSIYAFSEKEISWMIDFQRHLAAAMFLSGHVRP